MTQLLGLQGEENVLEIGTGSGYQAAILAALSKQVYTIERHERLAKRAAEVFQELHMKNIEVHHGDGSVGWPEHSPYDAIMVTAAAPEVPKPLLEQLAQGGRLVLPVGGPRGQHLQCWRRKGAKYTHDEIVPVSFVPLRGEHGWEKDWDGFFW
jgi:protein-L-isoaspartate(D-aspartate) O-methyltransferase